MCVYVDDILLRTCQNEHFILTMPGTNVCVYADDILLPYLTIYSVGTNVGSDVEDIFHFTLQNEPFVLPVHVCLRR
jgi:hypothetical protein